MTRIQTITKLMLMGMQEAWLEQFTSADLDDMYAKIIARNVKP